MAGTGRMFSPAGAQLLVVVAQKQRALLSDQCHTCDSLKFAYCGSCRSHSAPCSAVPCAGLVTATSLDMQHGARPMPDTPRQRHAAHARFEAGHHADAQASSSQHTSHRVCLMSMLA